MYKDYLRAKIGETKKARFVVDLIPESIGFVVSDPTAAIKCTSTPGQGKALALIGIGVAYTLKEQEGRGKLGRGLIEVPNARSDKNEPNRPSDIWVDDSSWVEADPGCTVAGGDCTVSDYFDGFAVSFSKCLCVHHNLCFASVA